MKFKCSRPESGKKLDRNQSSSGSLSGDKSGDIKNDSGDSGGDSDEKNPDIIPPHSMGGETFWFLLYQCCRY